MVSTTQVQSGQFSVNDIKYEFLKIPITPSTYFPASSHIQTSVPYVPISKLCLILYKENQKQCQFSCSRTSKYPLMPSSSPSPIDYTHQDKKKKSFDPISPSSFFVTANCLQKYCLNAFFYYLDFGYLISTVILIYLILCG